MQLAYTETPLPGVVGQLVNTEDYDSITRVNDTGSEIFPGTFVVRGAADTDCALPAAAGDITGGKALGFVLNEDLHINPLTITDVDRAAFQSSEAMPVCTRGWMWVMPEVAVNKGDPCYVRFAASGVVPGGGVIGSGVRNDNDPTGVGSAATAALLQFGRFETSTTAPNQMAKLRFNVLT